MIQHTQITANQTAFPVLVTQANLPAEMLTAGGGNAAQSNGGDIRFSSDAAGASQLACEVVNWTQNANPTLAVAQIWVPVSVLSASNVTIYVWYNAGGGQSQPAAGAAFGSQSVWDANFAAVYHPVVSANSTANSDSTVNGHNITTVGVGGVCPVLVSNQMGTAWSWTGTNAHGDVLPAAGVPMFNATATGIPTGSAASTLEAWFNLNGQLTPFDNTGQGMFGWGGAADSDFWTFAFHNDNKLYLSLQWAGFPGANIAMTPDTNWHHAVVTNPSGNTAYSGISFYLDGALKTLAGSTGTIVNNFSSIAAGAIPHDHNWHYKGMLGEMRISNVARSATWIGTQFNSQNSPGTFVIAGTPGGTGAGAGSAGLAAGYSGGQKGGSFL